jgi:NADH-quinone oxidoreductase subunit G
MIIEVTDAAGITIPRFCYHKKLSIAANCRMCLVEVEKAPKPLPACATPVDRRHEGLHPLAQGHRGAEGDHGVPADQPPARLPDLRPGRRMRAAGRGDGLRRRRSRFTERKRVVSDEDIGPLIATDMTRCIHCTRCVRFGGRDRRHARARRHRARRAHAIGTYIEHSVTRSCPATSSTCARSVR